MGKLTQKQGVYQATRSVLQENGVVFEDRQDVKPLVTTEMRKNIISIVVAGLKEGNIMIRDDFDEVKLESYTKGMVSNWFRKDERLNGGVKHEIANPGSRAGATNPKIREIKKLLATLTSDDKNKAKVEAVLAEEIAKHKAATQKKIEIDIDQLPDDLKDLVDS